MEKQPFTPEGVLALNQWLYSLPPLEFNAQIKAMEINFEAWSLAHLELDEQQLAFYNRLSGTAKSNLAYNVTLGCSYKKPVSLVQLLQKIDEPSVEGDKLFEPKSTLTVTSHNDGSYDVDGEVVIEVTYIS